MHLGLWTLASSSSSLCIVWLPDAPIDVRWLEWPDDGDSETKAYHSCNNPLFCLLRFPLLLILFAEELLHLLISCHRRKKQEASCCCWSNGNGTSSDDNTCVRVNSKIKATRGMLMNLPSLVSLPASKMPSQVFRNWKHRLGLGLPSLISSTEKVKKAMQASTIDATPPISTVESGM